jgi:hypothetical protein
MWTTLGPALLTLLSSIASTTNSSTVSNIASFLTNLIPTLIGEASALLTPVENIISQLEGNGSVSAADMAAVEAARDAINAQIQAQAKLDGLTTDDNLNPPSAGT